MPRNFLKYRIMSSGVVILALGIVGAILGLAALANYSEKCYVNPGGFPCATQYQVSLLAPLYPLGVGLVLLGLVLTVLGATFTYVGYSKMTRSVIGTAQVEPKKN